MMYRLGNQLSPVSAWMAPEESPDSAVMMAVRASLSIGSIRILWARIRLLTPTVASTTATADPITISITVTRVRAVMPRPAPVAGPDDRAVPGC